jgi:hypothetical protein
MTPGSDGQLAGKPNGIARPAKHDLAIIGTLHLEKPSAVAHQSNQRQVLCRRRLAADAHIEVDRNADRTPGQGSLSECK